MPQDRRFMQDIALFLKTETYVLQNTSLTQKESITQILNRKSGQNKDRYNDLLRQARDLIKGAVLYASGVKLDIKGEDARQRLERGFEELVDYTYPNLGMLHDVSYTDSEIGSYLRPKGQGLLESLGEAESEVLQFILNNKNQGQRTTVKGLLEQFTRKPYGWYQAAVLCNLAGLCGRGKVEIRMEGDSLEGDDLERALLNSRLQGNLVVEPLADFTASQFRQLKNAFEGLFHKAAVSGDARALVKETNEALKKLVDELRGLCGQSDEFPFLRVLQQPLQAFSDCQDKPQQWYFDAFVQQKSGFSQILEDVVNHIREFMGGTQKDIYREARLFIKDHRANLDYIEGDEASGIESILDSDDCFKGGKMREVKGLLETLKANVAKMLEAELSKASQKIEEMRQDLVQLDEYAKLDGELQAKMNARFDDLAATIGREKHIPLIKDKVRIFEETDYKGIVKEALTHGQPSVDSEVGVQPAVQVVSIKETKVPFAKKMLSDEADVEGYTQSMRDALLSEIHKGKRIML